MELQILKCIILALIIYFIISFLNKSRENFSECATLGSSVSPEDLEIVVPATQDEYPPCNDRYCPTPSTEMANPTSAKGCPLAEADKKLQIYRFDNLLGKHRLCPCDDNIPNKTAKKAHDQFFDFRDKTNQESSGEDVVDRIHSMYVDGNTDIARGHQGQRIKDLFDNLTQGVHLYDRTCVRIPHQDSVVEAESYGINGTSGFSLSGHEWRDDKKGEYVTTGGMFGDTYGYDPTVNPYLSTLKMQKIKDLAAAKYN